MITDTEQNHLTQHARPQYLKRVLQLVGIVKPGGLHQRHDQLLKLPRQFRLQVVQKVLPHRKHPSVSQAEPFGGSPYVGTGAAALRNSARGHLRRQGRPVSE